MVEIDMMEKEGRSGTMRKKKYKKLSFKVILLIIMVILPLNITLFVMANRISEEMIAQVQLSLQNTADLYMNTLDLQMQQTDYYLHNLYISDANAMIIRQHSDELKYQNACVNFQQTLNTEVQGRGICDVYFFYQESTGNYLIGAKPAIKRSVVVETLEGLLPEQKKWEHILVNDIHYLIRIVKMSDMYYGALINLDNIIEQIYKTINYDSITVEFRPQNVCQASGDSLVVVSESNESTVVLELLVDRKEILESFSVLDRLILLISIISILLIPLMYLVIRRWILKPLKVLNQAHQEMEIGNEKYRIVAISYSREMEMAYQAFNHMADNIHSLKLENMEKELAKNQLKLNNLQLQIRPHFLMNTFNLIFHLVSEGEQESVKELILYLSCYFRHIFRSGKELEQFPKELRLIEGYVKVAQIRYPGMLEFYYKIDPEISLVRVPPLLIHNFIENIINHALVKGKKMHIMLTAEYMSGIVSFEISDDGKGMSEAEVERINSGKFSDSEERVYVGLYNSIMRLKYFYGDEATLQVESELNEGTVFTVTFPYNLEDE